MAFTVDIDAMTSTPGKPGIVSMDPAKPPVKAIPFMEYPRCIYKHPKEPYKIIIHRNAKHEVVDEERVPSEHLTRVVADKKELAEALKDGWALDAYVPAGPVDPNANLYSE